MKKITVGISILFFSVSGWQCSEGVNLFTIEDDIQLGMQVKEQILADPATYPVIERTSKPQAYTYVENIRNKILASGRLTYTNKFAWEIYIINNDSVLNAFCTPGGYIFVYTGLIKYLEAEDQLAGVLAHEFAHADKRHSTEQLTKIYGIQLLVSFLGDGTAAQIAQIAASLTALEFSRANEREADECSVQYLCPSDYEADGAADFFAKLIADGQLGNPIPFLSTHPDPGNRVQDIQNKANELGCQGTGTYDQAYQNFKSLF